MYFRILAVDGTKPNSDNETISPEVLECLKQQINERDDLVVSKDWMVEKPIGRVQRGSADLCHNKLVCVIWIDDDFETGLQVTGPCLAGFVAPVYNNVDYQISFFTLLPPPLYNPTPAEE